MTVETSTSTSRIKKFNTALILSRAVRVHDPDLLERSSPLVQGKDR